MDEIQTKVFQRQKYSEFSSLLFTVIATPLPSDVYFVKLTQPLTVQFLKFSYWPEIQPYQLSYGLRNPYRNLKSQNSQDYALKPQRNSASVPTFVYTDKVPIYFLLTLLHIPSLHGICGLPT